MPAPREAILLFTPEWNGMHPAAWRDPASPADGAMDVAHVVSLVQAAERAKFHAFFLADALGFRLEITPEALSHTAAAARLEPFTLMSALTMCTERIGLILTAHTTYDQPFHLARRFASLDHLSAGRAGWNVVTGGFSKGAKHFGRDEHVSHAERYAQGEEIVESVFGLWDSWEDDAFVRDQASGCFFDPDKLHVFEHRGRHVSVTGPLNIPRPPQGRPVIAQAGSSPTGRAFAARYGEVIFTLQPDLERAKAFYAELKAQAAELGRDPEHLKILPSLTLVLGETQAAAEEKAARLDRLAHPSIGVELLGAFLETDLSGCPLDGPLPEIVETELGTKTVQHFFARKAREEHLTIRELIPSALTWGALTSTPQAVADHIEQWVTERGADGFNVTFADMPGSMDLFCEQVIPELQRRGVFQLDYRGTTLRENLGLPRPANRYAHRRGAGANGGPARRPERTTFLEAGSPMRF